MYINWCSGGTLNAWSTVTKGEVIKWKLKGELTNCEDTDLLEIFISASMQFQDWIQILLPLRAQ